MRKNPAKALVAFVLASVMCLTGCSTAKDIFKILTGPSGRELSEKAEQQLDEALDAVMKKDADKLKGLFSANTVNESQIKELIAGIDGDCVSGTKKGYAGRAHFVTEVTEYNLYDKGIKELKTSTGAVYTVRAVCCVVSKFDEKDTGIQYVSLYQGDKLIKEAGKLIEQYDPRKLPEKEVKEDLNKVDSMSAKQEYIQNFLLYLNKGDAKGYEGKFRPSIRNNAKDKFDAIRSFIGEIDSYSYIDVSDSSGGSWNKDHWERMSGDCAVYDILNKKGKRFEISFYIVFINTDNDTSEGINYIEIRKVENNLNDEFEHKVIDKMTIGQKPVNG